MESTNREDRKGRKDAFGFFALLAPFAVLIIVLGLGLIASTAYAQGPTQDDVNRVADKLYCPVCENITLANCPTQACVQWRARIRDELAAGKSDDEIIQGFVRDYGMRVVGAPPLPLLWVLPPLGLIAAAIFLAWVVRSWSSRPRPAAPSEAAPAPQDLDEYRARLEREVREEVGR